MTATKTPSAFWQTVAFGILSGTRSLSAPAIASHRLSHHHSANLEKTPLNFIQSPKVATALKVLALTEVAADKLPSAPDRTIPASLAFRCLSGALVGASVYKAAGSSIVTGALVGSAVAAGASFLGLFLRKAMTNKAHIPNPLAGAIEDVLVAGSGFLLGR